MTPTIGSNLIASGTASGSNETFIEVVNGMFVRQFGITSWQKIRLAMRYRWWENPTYLAGYSGTIPDIMPNQQFYVGFCNGTSSVPGDQYVQNFIGICPLDGQIYVRNIYTSPFPIYNGNYARTIRFTGNVKSDYGYANSNYWYQETVTSSLDIVMVDLLRIGLDSVRVGVYIKYTNSSMGEYYPTANFLTDMMADTPARSAYNYTIGYAGTFPHYEAVSGSMNAVCVSWNRDFPRIQITDLYVIRLA